MGHGLFFQIFLIVFRRDTPFWIWGGGGFRWGWSGTALAKVFVFRGAALRSKSGSKDGNLLLSWRIWAQYWINWSSLGSKSVGIFRLAADTLSSVVALVWWSLNASGSRYSSITRQILYRTGWGYILCSVGDSSSSSVSSSSCGWKTIPAREAVSTSADGTWPKHDVLSKYLDLLESLTHLHCPFPYWAYFLIQPRSRGLHQLLGEVVLLPWGMRRGGGIYSGGDDV